MINNQQIRNQKNSESCQMHVIKYAGTCICGLYYMSQSTQFKTEILADKSRGCCKDFFTVYAGLTINGGGNLEIYCDVFATREQSCSNYFWKSDAVCMCMMSHNS